MKAVGRMRKGKLVDRGVDGRWYLEERTVGDPESSLIIIFSRVGILLILVECVL